MKQQSHHQIATYLTNHVLSELVRYVIEDTGCSIEQAMKRVYNSRLMDYLQDEEGLGNMRQLAHNMAFFLKCLEAGDEKGLTLNEEPKARTNFIR